MVGWHHRLNGHESEWTLGVGDGQGGLVCCSPRNCKESDMTEQLNWTEFIYTYIFFLISKNIKEIINYGLLGNFSSRADVLIFIHMHPLSTYFVQSWTKQNTAWKKQTTGRIQAWILEHEMISQWPLIIPKGEGFLVPTYRCWVLWQGISCLVCILNDNTVIKAWGDLFSLVAQTEGLQTKK